MDRHFQAYTFVDRIHSIRDGVVLGEYSIPQVPSFPNSLIAEAIGQLAAWHAVNQTNFELRPLAGIAAKVSFLATVRPGDKLDLRADVDEVSKMAISYGGEATVAGRPVMKVEGSVGPMLPAADFDDPDALRARYAQLLEGTATIGGFEGVPEPDLTIHGREATLRVPTHAAYFEDHFPRRPVLPGTLLMDAHARLAQSIFGERLITSVHSVKLRSFIPPGSTVHLIAKNSDPGEVKIESMLDGKPAGAARWHAEEGD